VRELLDVVPEFNIPTQDAAVAARPAFVCRHCGAPMIVIEILVSRHASNVGYSLDSLMRASPVVNCQLIRALS
jgi:hypothetical protein